MKKPNAGRIVFVLALALAACPSAFSAVVDPLVSGEVRVATHLRDIDAGALAALKRKFSDEHRLADRGAPFRSTDVLMGRDPASRRLVLAAVSGDTWFIHYEHGGYGLHSHLVALTRSRNSWRVVYSATAFYPYHTLPKLRDAFRKRQFRMDTYEL
jgi:hypothetical protein